ncbi:MAG: hypothetical protein A2231_03110 [Candidatus Firestonebacteria bacterium RIFOXYA2_FULL_40_8]|nr:MAG: hypothetical protein A2231_03110 [Candidatus Firestonebacteria bacterium RIFOXYA2_FULL_40_8]
MFSFGRRIKYLEDEVIRLREKIYYKDIEVLDAKFHSAYKTTYFFEEIDKINKKIEMLENVCKRLS